MKKNLYILLLIISMCTNLFATPSTQIWNPSTDVQEINTFHLGIDNYFSDSNNITCIGLTYGLFKNIEVGLDVIDPSLYPVYFNAKYGLPETSLPSFAIGVFNVGFAKDITDYNMFYLLSAKTFNPIGRLSLGGYSGSNKQLFLNDNNNPENVGIIASWDKTLTSKIWASIDYASGNNFYGSLSSGVSYSFTNNVSIIFGYVKYNNSNINKYNQFTTQLDINF